MYSCTSLFSRTRCQVVTYRRLKRIENSKTVSQKRGRGHLWQVVIYERFQYILSGFDREHFWCFGKVIAYRRWSHVKV